MEREKINEKRKEKQDKARELEQFYTNGKVDDILESLEKRKKELVEDMISYAQEHTKECKWDREGNPIDFKVDFNPFVVRVASRSVGDDYSQPTKAKVETLEISGNKLKTVSSKNRGVVCDVRYLL